jgi:hypothetical protein
MSLGSRDHSPLVCPVAGCMDGEFRGAFDEGGVRLRGPIGPTYPTSQGGESRRGRLQFESMAGASMIAPPASGQGKIPGGTHRETTPLHVARKIRKFTYNSHNVLFREENAIGFQICLIAYTSNPGTTVTNYLDTSADNHSYIYSIKGKQT